ncbi:MAG: amidohydrolase family protein [Planctomycetota bacterium]
MVACVASAAGFVAGGGDSAAAQTGRVGEVLVYGDVVHTMAGGKLSTIKNGVVWVEDGVVRAVGPADSTAMPRRAMTTLRAAVVVPGLIDGRSTAGLTGIFNNQREDQDAIERSSPIQPELRAIDAYHALDPLVGFLRDKGVTTLHTGHAMGEVVSGQTMLVKTAGTNVSEALVRDGVALAATLSPAAIKGGGKSPGTRGKLVAMLRAELIAGREYAEKWSSHEADDAEGTGDDEGDGGNAPARDLRKEAVARVLRGEMPLLVTANRVQDIDSALRLQEEFGFELWLDSGAESYLMLDELRAREIEVFVHPTMARPWSEMENMSWTTAGVLADAGIDVVMQSSYEAYVPKVRVVLFEAAIAAVNGLGVERAMSAMTYDAARVLGIDDRVGSIEVGKDGDLALYDGDPLEYTTRCVGTVIEGIVVSDGE